ncbi:MAG: hypothetical protein ACI9F9_001848 [Candidatus Paceibacteria bacterium]|jgi:hypothetical protein
MSSYGSEREVQLVEELFQRIGSDISMITDRDLVVGTSTVAKETERPAGKGRVHISFRLGFEQGGELHHGCLLFPLPDAISLACYLMMIPDDGVKSKRTLKAIDESIKDAMLEVGNFIGGAADAAMREAIGVDAKVSSEGCQGVPGNVRPAMIYNEGESLVVGRAKATIHDYPEFDILIMLPELDGVSG